jgi:MFS family permease
MYYAAITPLQPKLTGELGLGKAGAGVLAGAYAAGTLLGALPGGWLVARAGVKPTILLGLTLAPPRRWRRRPPRCATGRS